jgi:hypothetical protein
MTSPFSLDTLRASVRALPNDERAEAIVEMFRIAAGEKPCARGRRSGRRYGRRCSSSDEPAAAGHAQRRGRTAAGRRFMSGNRYYVESGKQGPSGAFDAVVMDRETGQLGSKPNKACSSTSAYGPISDIGHVEQFVGVWTLTGHAKDIARATQITPHQPW